MVIFIHILTDTLVSTSLIGNKFMYSRYKALLAIISYFPEKNQPQARLI